MDQAVGVVIRKLHVEGFGCVKDATVRLDPLTVFVGPNDSGKSMLLRALVMLARASREAQGWRGVFPERADLTAHTFNGLGDSVRFGLAGEIGAEAFEYEVEVSAAAGYSAIESERLEIGDRSLVRADRKLRFQGPGDETGEAEAHHSDGIRPFLHPDYLTGSPLRQRREMASYFNATSALRGAVASIQLYSLRPEQLRAPTGLGVALGSDGFGLPTAIADLMLRDRDAMDRVESALSSAMPHVRGVAVAQQAIGNGWGYGIELITRSGARIPSHMISDGVLLYLGYLYLVRGPRPASILLIEEPETGIHFRLLQSVMTLLRGMSTGAHGGPPTQILLTTHSPMLLNLVEPEEIRVVQRGDDGASQISAFSDARDLDALLDYQGPGEVWVNQGEDYLTRGGAPRS